LHPESFPGQIPRRGAIFWGSVSDLWSSHAAIEITFLHFEIQVKKTVKVRYLRRGRVFCQKSVKELKNLKKRSKSELKRWKTTMKHTSIIRRAQNGQNGPNKDQLPGRFRRKVKKWKKRSKNDQKTTQTGPRVSSRQVKTAQNDPKRSKEAQKCQKPSVYIINRWDDVCKTCTFYSRLTLKSV